MMTLLAIEELVTGVARISPKVDGLSYTLPHDVPADAGNQGSWRQCVRCLSLVFWDGHSPRGFCPAGGQHNVQVTANNYVLPNDYAEDDHNQSFWYLCKKCFGLYWHGNDRVASVCPKDHGKHDRGGVSDFNRPEFNCLLPHDIDDAGHTKNFHFCVNCSGLFLDTGFFRGVCPNGGAHVPADFNFALAHDAREDSRHQASWRVCEKCAGGFFDGARRRVFAPKAACTSAPQAREILSWRTVHAARSIRIGGTARSVMAS